MRTHRSVETNGIRMHIAEQGAGPLIVLCHGFPESWYPGGQCRDDRLPQKPLALSPERYGPSLSA
jgi:pimeloyl-ACP methyl ester carboxylesterase